MARLYQLTPLARGPFEGLDLVARSVFGLIYDRWALSRKNGRFRDSFGVFCYYERTELAFELGITLPTLRAAVKRLEARQLIELRREAIGAPIRYYVTSSPEVYFDDITAWQELW